MVPGRPTNLGFKLLTQKMEMKNGNCKRKSLVQKLANCTLRDLATKLDVHGWHCMLSYLSPLPISVFRSLDTEANKFYDRTNILYDAALLKRCYTHMLFVQ